MSLLNFSFAFWIQTDIIFKMNVLNIFRPKITVVAHSGTFHADDVFAVATLCLWAEENGKRIELIRTRDEKVIERADMVVDVGSKYDPTTNRFDHHQRGGAGERENKIPYASFGLVWKHYGEDVCKKYSISKKVEPKEIWKLLDQSLVSPIDARDNGLVVSLPNDLGVVDHRTSNAISLFNSTWIENSEESSDERFKKALEFAKDILEREVVWSEAEILGNKETLEIIKAQNYPEILILENRVEWEREVVKHKNIKLVISKGKEHWSVQVARDDIENYDSNRIEFPESWQGLRDEELEKESGVAGAIFCARGGWFAKANTKEAAISLAQKALLSK